MVRVQISLSEDTLLKVDKYAKEVGLTRSAFLSMASLDYIRAKEKAPLVTEAFSNMALLLDARVKDEITEDEFKERLDKIKIPK